jgi:hypothetical protein
MRRYALLCAGAAVLAAAAFGPSGRGEPLPFKHKVEVYREKDTDVAVFALRLEQPFLAEEFEKSNYLRLTALDRNAYLIYPTQTRFAHKHAEFYGRLRGKGKAKVRLAYETVTETARGSRKVDLRHADLEIDIPAEPGGPRAIYTAWANEQNQHFLKLLSYYPDETFYQYALLQSKDRYGVTPPRFDKPRPARAELESSLYDMLTGSLAIQEALQQQALEDSSRPGDLDVHISELTPPRLPSLDYTDLLEKKAAKGIRPSPHEAARLVPEDQYFLHFNSLKAATELQDLATDWGNDLLRVFTVRAQDNRLRAKFEEQLCLRRDPLLRLFADAIVTELALTGGDPFFLEGTDLTVLLRLKRPEVFRKAAAGWLAEARKKHPGLVERTFNYRGHKVAARYTEDRQVSSFVVEHGDHVVFSNSHRAIRQVVDAATGKVPRLYDAPDYRHATILLPPSSAADTGYFYASRAFLEHLVSPQAKIAERRRLLCFNNLVMLNNASLFYRLENGKSPASLTSLTEGRFVDLDKVVCPHGGAYSWDARRDTCTCSLHNRLMYLTPNAELPVLKVSRAEKDEYQRFRTRYEQFWQQALDPIAARITVAPRVQLELCITPLAGGSLYNDLRRWVDDTPQPIDSSRFARSAVVSVSVARGRKAIADLLRNIPGMAEALKADPTLTDLSWLGDSVALHYCDGETILELDPTRFRDLDVGVGGKVPVLVQALAGAALTATEVPTYFTLDVEDRDKAARLLELLLRKIPLEKGKLLTLPTRLDAYRLPDYKEHTRYVLSFRVHALKVRLHLALVGNQLVAATKADVLKEVIDAATAARERRESAKAPRAQVWLRLNARALGRLQDNFGLSWAEKARLACHRNTISIYNLVKLYDVPLAEVPRLAEAKYGVRYYCPEHGVYEYDARRDQVVCSVHGNRQDSRQYLPPGKKGSFTRFLEGLDEVAARLRFEGDALYTTVEIVRRRPVK